MHKRLRSVVDELSEYTHVRPGTLIESDEAAAVFMEQALEAIMRFLGAVADIRSAISTAVSEYANDLAIDALTDSVVQELDELSTYTVVDEVVADDIRVVEIGPKQIKLDVRSTVYVQLN